MKKILIATAGIALFLFPAGIAQADSNDDAFVQAMNNAGVAGDSTAMINIAHQLCDGLAGGSSPDALRDELVSQLHLQPNRAGIMIAQASAHYCPQFGNMQFKTGST